jgi:hypothetical protein
MDRIHGAVITDRLFTRKRGQRLEDFLKTVKRRMPEK